MNAELLKLLREQKKAVETPIDGEQMRDEWVAAVRGLVEQVRVWLKPATENKLLSLSIVDRDHAEERLGRYKVPTVEITTPNGTAVLLEPYARMIVGGLGRVDLHSGARSAMLVRGDKGAWVFATQSHGRIEPKPLNEESFSQALREVLGA